MGDLDVAANRPRLMGLFKQLTYGAPHFRQHSRHDFLKIERLPSERIHQILVTVAVPEQSRKQIEESRFWVTTPDQAASFLDQFFHLFDDNGLEQSLFGRKMPVKRSNAYARPLGNFVDRRCQAGCGEDLPCRLHDQFLVAHGISAHTRKP
jgi:hypothetical protein